MDPSYSLYSVHDQRYNHPTLLYTASTLRTIPLENPGSSLCSLANPIPNTETSAQKTTGRPILLLPWFLGDITGTSSRRVLRSQEITFGIPKTACHTPLPTKTAYVVQLTSGHVRSPWETNPYPSSAGERAFIGGSGEEGMIRCVHRWSVRNGRRMYPAA